MVNSRFWPKYVQSLGESLRFQEWAASFTRPDAAQIGVRRKKFPEAIQTDLGCPVLRAKIFFFRFSRNWRLLCAIPPRLQRGVSRSSRHARRVAVDADVPIDERHLLRTAKSCGPGAPMQAPSWRRCSTHRRR